MAGEAVVQKGVLGWIERTGNRLPDPAFIFIWLIGLLILLSIAAAAFGLAVPHPTEVGEDGAPVTVAATSLVSPENIQKLWTEMPTTFTHFAPLGYVLTVMLGAGVAERSGLFAAAMRAGVRNAPKMLLTPVVTFVAILSHMAADAAYVVLIPLAGVLYAAAGRHPIAGIACAFAGVSGGFGANVVPGQLDALLFGITETAAQAIDPSYVANIAGNWWFIIGMTIVFVPVIWFITDVVIEPRLGKYAPETDIAAATAQGDAPLEPAQRKGLAWAGLGLLAVVALWLFFLFGPGTPLIDESATPEARLSPFYRSLVAAFFVLFLVAGWAYGAAAGTIKNHRDVLRMMSEAMGDMAYYLVLAFAAAHFVAMFNWSNLGLIFAVLGANGLESSALPAPALLVVVVLFACLVDLFVGSASAKWAMMAPVLVPMLMLLGISPEMTTAAYRVGDSVTNIITPLMVYFPLVMTFCQRWRSDFGLGSLVAIMAPYSFWLLMAGLALTVGWTMLDLPLGPGAAMSYTLPATSP